MTDYIYIPTPISEKPEKAGEYNVIMNNDAIGKLFFNGTTWWKCATRWAATHWLRPVPRSEYDREVAQRIYKII